MAAPADLRFTKTHEWVRADGDVVTFGIADYAQAELGDITYLELPEAGIGNDLEVGVRNKWIAAEQIKTPFYKRPKP